MSSNNEVLFDALAQYQKTISAHNRQALEKYVNFIDAAQPNEDDGLDDDEAKDLKMEAIGTLLGDDTLLQEVGALQPDEALSRYDEMIPKAGLDGAFRLGQGEDRIAKHDEYFDTIAEALRQKSREDVRETIQPPKELIAISKQVDGLVGPGLPNYRDNYQLAFWSGPVQDREAYLERVKTFDELTSLVIFDDGWMIAGGWESGQGPNGYCYVVYGSRPESTELHWRYVVVLEGSVDAFDSISDLLKWYAHFREQDLAIIPEFSEEDVFSLDLN